MCVTVRARVSERERNRGREGGREGGRERKREGGRERGREEERGRLAAQSRCVGAPVSGHVPLTRINEHGVRLFRDK